MGGSSKPAKNLDSKGSKATPNIPPADTNDPSKAHLRIEVVGSNFPSLADCIRIFGVYGKITGLSLSEHRKRLTIQYEHESDVLNAIQHEDEQSHNGSRLKVKRDVECTSPVYGFSTNNPAIFERRTVPPPTDRQHNTQDQNLAERDYEWQRRLDASQQYPHGPQTPIPNQGVIPNCRRWLKQKGPADVLVLVEVSVEPNFCKLVHERVQQSGMRSIQYDYTDDRAFNAFKQFLRQKSEIFGIHIDQTSAIKEEVSLLHREVSANSQPYEPAIRQLALYFRASRSRPENRKRILDYFLTPLMHSLSFLNAGDKHSALTDIVEPGSSNQIISQPAQRDVDHSNRSKISNLVSVIKHKFTKHHSGIRPDVLPSVLANDQPIILADDQPNILAEDQPGNLSEDQPGNLAEDQPGNLADHQPAVLPDGHVDAQQDVLLDVQEDVQADVQEDIQEDVQADVQHDEQPEIEDAQQEVRLDVEPDGHQDAQQEVRPDVEPDGHQVVQPELSVAADKPDPSDALVLESLPKYFPPPTNCGFSSRSLQRVYIETDSKRLEAVRLKQEEARQAYRKMKAEQEKFLEQSTVELSEMEFGSLDPRNPNFLLNNPRSEMAAGYRYYQSPHGIDMEEQGDGESPQTSSPEGRDLQEVSGEEQAEDPLEEDSKTTQVEKETKQRRLDAKDDDGAQRSFVREHINPLTQTQGDGDSQGENADQKEQGEESDQLKTAEKSEPGEQNQTGGQSEEQAQLSPADEEPTKPDDQAQAEAKPTRVRRRLPEIPIEIPTRIKRLLPPLPPHAKPSELPHRVLPSTYMIHIPKTDLQLHPYEDVPSSDDTFEDDDDEEEQVTDAISDLNIEDKP